MAALLQSLGLTDKAFAQHLGQGIDDGVSLWRIVAALVFCLGIAVPAALFLRSRMDGNPARFFAGRKNNRLEIVEILRIRPQIDLCIVACDGDELLMVFSPQGASLLRPLSRGASPSPPVDPRS